MECLKKILRLERIGKEMLKSPIKKSFLNYKAGFLFELEVNLSRFRKMGFLKYLKMEKFSFQTSFLDSLYTNKTKRFFRFVEYLCVNFPFQDITHVSYSLKYVLYTYTYIPYINYNLNKNMNKFFLLKYILYLF